MSHELRTPLNAVIGFSEVLLDRMFGELNERQEEYLRDIRELGPPPAGAAQRDPRPVQGRGRARWSSSPPCSRSPPLLDYARRDAARAGGGRTASPCTSTWATASALIEADELRFKQVLLNLLSNAVKFTPDGGPVRGRATGPGDDLA